MRILVLSFALQLVVLLGIVQFESVFDVLVRSAKGSLEELEAFEGASDKGAVG